MADYRQIHTSIWTDEWFMELEPGEKLLFIYLFSNRAASLSGLYKLPVRVMAFETGLDVEYIQECLRKFSAANKVHYQEGVVWVVNMRRYHETKSEKVQIRIAREVALIPDCEIKSEYLKAMDSLSDTVSIGYIYPSAINLKNLNLTQLKAEDAVLEGRDGEREEGIIQIAERLIGLPATPEDIKVLNAWERDGVIEDDIRAALQWRVDNNKPPVKTIRQLNGGVNISRLKRLQSQNGHRNANQEWRPEDHASEVYS